MATNKDRAGLLRYTHTATAKIADKATTPRTVGAVVDTDPHELRPNPLQAGLFDLPEGEELARLTDDIQQNGIHDPLQAMTDGTILAGHTRLKIALTLKMKSVPVLWVAEKTREEQRAFLIRDNLHRRQLTRDDKTRLLAELYPGYFDADSTAGRKPEKSGNGYPISAPAIAAEIGTSEKTVKNMKATHKAAKQIATAQGRPAPTPEDYKAAAQEKNQARKEREKTKTPKSQHTPQDFPGMDSADKTNKGKGPIPFKMPDKSATLAGIIDRAADRVGKDAPEMIARDLIDEIRKAGLLP